MKIITISENQKGKRLDLVLMDELPNLTRSTVKKIIIEGMVTVNNPEINEDNKLMPNYRVRVGEEISVDNTAIRTYVKEGDTEASQIKAKEMKLEIIYEDKNLIAVNKPSGIQSHPARLYDNDSLLNGLYFYVRNESKFDKDVKIRLVHRLDKDTSGVIIATKNLEAHEFYSEQFESRNVAKEYYAIVHGDFANYLERNRKTSLTIATHIAKSPKDDKRYINVQAKRGKPAKSTVYFEKYFDKFGKYKFSLVKVVPETGRTHQIRVHLSSVGFPILGDTLYGGQKYRRLMLHAYSLTIPLYKSRDEITLVAGLPELFEFERFPEDELKINN